MNFSNAELIDMFYVLGASDKNCLLAVRIYKARYFRRRAPRKEAFEKFIERFNHAGCVAYEKHERITSVLTEEKELTALSVTDDPHTSLRIISRKADISQTSVVTILKKSHMHPYHIQLHQELYDTDHEKRLVFCEWTKEKIRYRTDFFDFVLVADKATFQKNDIVICHNFYCCSTSNPVIIQTHSQTRWCLNVWGGILCKYIIGPYFFLKGVLMAKPI